MTRSGNWHIIGEVDAALISRCESTGQIKSRTLFSIKKNLTPSSLIRVKEGKKRKLITLQEI
jgi:hypothetical protein